MKTLTEDQVQSFLNQFHSKLKVFGIIYRDDRGKNQKTLDELNNRGVMWVFGKDVKEREVYIKIMICEMTNQTICISFHLAERPLVYPFKK